MHRYGSRAVQPRVLGLDRLGAVNEFDCRLSPSGGSPCSSVPGLTVRGDGAQGRNRTTDTVIFSHVLYQLSYLGPRFRARPGPVGPERADPLTLAFLAVHPGLLGRRAGDSIALAEPAQKVAILAPARAEGRVLRARRLPADRAGFGFSLLRHRRPRWAAMRPRARRCFRRPAERVRRASRASFRGPR